MWDAIETSEAAVNERYLIRRFNISTPFSLTDGQVRYDQPLVPTNYKGMHLYGKPRSSYYEELVQWYRFRLRGSLIKVANNGVHNQDSKDPIALLYALDDLITALRIDPFRTPLNGLELSVTIPVNDAQQICSSLVSYLNRPPNLKMIDRDGSRRPYVEVEAGQHTLKIYAPTEDALRVEIKIDKMQFLGATRPQTLAELARPGYAGLYINKLVAAFHKIIWKCATLNLDALTPAERDLYLLGRVADYWQVRREDYENETDFKCVEQQRYREREIYNDIIRRHWLSEPPAELERRMGQQLKGYSELMHTRFYRALLAICLERWQHVGNLPFVVKLPNRLRLPPLSEIYRLYLGRFPTTTNQAPAQLNKRWPSVHDLFSHPAEMASLSQGYIHRPSQAHHPPLVQEEHDHERQRKQVSKLFSTELRRLGTAINAPGGLHYSIDELVPMLSAKTRLVLACRGRSLHELARAVDYPACRSKPTPIFPS